MKIFSTTILLAHNYFLLLVFITIVIGTPGCGNKDQDNNVVLNKAKPLSIVLNDDRKISSIVARINKETPIHVDLKYDQGSGISSMVLENIHFSEEVSVFKLIEAILKKTKGNFTLSKNEISIFGQGTETYKICSNEKFLISINHLNNYTFNGKTWPEVKIATLFFDSDRIGEILPDSENIISHYSNTTSGLCQFAFDFSDQNNFSFSYLSFISPELIIIPVKEKFHFESDTFGLAAGTNLSLNPGNAPLTLSSPTKGNKRISIICDSSKSLTKTQINTIESASKTPFKGSEKTPMIKDQVSKMPFIRIRDFEILDTNSQSLLSQGTAIYVDPVYLTICEMDIPEKELNKDLYLSISLNRGSERKQATINCE